MKWTEIVSNRRMLQYTKEDTLDYIKLLFKNRKLTFGLAQKKLFDTAWAIKLPLKVTIEDVMDEVELPTDLTKMKPYQETQVTNVFKHLDKDELNQRWRLINVYLNVVRAKKKIKEIENWKILSDLCYKARMLRNIKED